jgi:hypothetical protein
MWSSPISKWTSDRCVCAPIVVGGDVDRAERVGLGALAGRVDTNRQLADAGAGLFTCRA